MIDTLRAEFRKLFTIRSTYFISLGVLLLLGIIAFYGTGFKGGPAFSPHALETSILNTSIAAGVIMGVIGILHIGHEYRYNTITYSITASNSRLKVIGAKLGALATLAIMVAVLAMLVALSFPVLGANLAGHPMGPQTIGAFDVVWRVLAFVIGSAWLGFAVGLLVRSVVGAVVIYFIVPTTIEPLANLLLKVSGNYLPFTVQGQILQSGPMPGTFSPLASLGMFSAYLAAVLIVGSLLFVRRDALS